MRKHLIASLLAVLCCLLGPGPLGLTVVDSEWSTALGGQRSLNREDQKPCQVVVLLLIDRLTLGDLPQLESLRNAQAQVAYALSNTRTAAGTTRENAYLTIGTFARSRSGSYARLAANNTERLGNLLAGQLYAGRTGLQPSRIVHPHIERIRRDLSALPYDVTVSLGELAIRGEKKVAVYGNADTPEHRDRCAVLVAMDSDGKVNAGSVDSDLYMTTTRPPFVITDYTQLMSGINESVSQGTNLLVVDLPDLFRLADSRAQLAPEVYYRSRRLEVARIDSFLKQLLRNLFPRTGRAAVLLVSPTVSEIVNQELPLAPVVLIAEATDDVPRPAGLLSSATTRRKGLVANLDVGPTALHLLGLETEDTGFGRVFNCVLGTNSPLVYLQQLATKVAVAHQVRSAALRAYTYAYIMAILTGALLVLTRWRPPRPYVRILNHIYLALAAFPLASMLIAYISPGRAIYYSLLAVIPLAFSLGLSAGSRSPLHAYALLYLVTAGTLLLDVAAGARGMGLSVLGYDLVGGARYYGIGNELMGVLLGSIIVGAGLAEELYPRLRSTGGRLAKYGLFLVVLFFLASPALGSNFGGTIAAAVGLAAAALKPGPPSLQGHWVDWKRTMLYAAAVSAAIAFFILSDALRGEGSSHVGLLVERLRQGDFTELWQVVVRKLSINYRLLQYTRWTWAFLLSLALLTAGVFFHLRPFQELNQRLPALRSALAGVTLTALVALAANDSGVVAAATTLIPPTSLLLHLVTQRWI